MVMFSELMRSTLVDEKDRRTRLMDLAIELEGHEYPPVTHLIFRNSQRMHNFKVSLPTCLNTEPHQNLNRRTVT